MHLRMKRLSSEWFDKHTTSAARDLIGCILRAHDKTYIITETEAYRGKDDPASHAHNTITARNKIMFGDPGHIYVYLVYGMHHCINFTTESRGTPGAVLIRSIYSVDNKKMINGPGRVTKSLGATQDMNGHKLDKSQLALYEGLSLNILNSERIGISKGLDLKWRFYTNDLSTEPVQKAVDKVVEKLNQGTI